MLKWLRRVGLGGLDAEGGGDPSEEAAEIGIALVEQQRGAAFAARLDHRAQPVERDALAMPGRRPQQRDVVADDPFRRAFVRLKTERRLYREAPNAVTFLTPTLFRTGIPLPEEVPIGTYTVDIKLFADGVMVGRTETAFEIVKVGFEQFVADTAQHNGLVYGIMTAMMALLTGWLASIIFRKD